LTTLFKKWNILESWFTVYQIHKGKVLSVSNVDLSNLSVAELKALKGSIDSFIDGRRQSELLDLCQKIDDMVEASGFTLEEVLQARTPKKRVVLPKYRNPGNPEQTWSGRGRKPGWVDELVKSGGDLNACLI
jgi:DNA-binding protein H-NS